MSWDDPPRLDDDAAGADLEECLSDAAAEAEATIDRASEATLLRSKPPKTVELAFRPAHALINEPRPVEIVESLAFADKVTVLVSESGGGKTFVLLDVSAAVSEGGTWHGLETCQGSVAYLSYEGDALGLRLQALREVGGHRLDHLYVLRGQDPLSPRVTREGEERSLGELAVLAAIETLAAQLKAARRPTIKLLVIDTVRASLSGSEDSSEHVAAYLRAVKRVLADVPGAAAILAHHGEWMDGENQKKRERGSSAWRGNCDCTLYLEAGKYDPKRGEAELTLTALKVRDAERPAPLHLVRRRVDLLLMDRHGGPVTSCVIERDRRSRADREAEQSAAIKATQRETDLAVLRAMRDFPSATSIAGLRMYLTGRTESVSLAVSRILQDRLAIQGKRGQPYTLTEAGLAQLNGSNE